MKETAVSEAVPTATTQMLIRRPVSEVFEAFVNPEIATKFWFTKSSGRLEPGKRVQWDWEMYGISTQVAVKTIETNRRILVEWSAYGAPTTVEWRFTPRKDGTTLVIITNRGFTGDAQAMVQQAVDSTGGFALALAGLKALLEHDIELNLVADKFPDGHEGK